MSVMIFDGNEYPFRHNPLNIAPKLYYLQCHCMSTRYNTGSYGFLSNTVGDMTCEIINTLKYANAFNGALFTSFSIKFNANDYEIVNKYNIMEIGFKLLFAICTVDGMKIPGAFGFHDYGSSKVDDRLHLHFVIFNIDCNTLEKPAVSSYAFANKMILAMDRVLHSKGISLIDIKDASTRNIIYNTIDYLYTPPPWQIIIPTEVPWSIVY